MSAVPPSRTLCVFCGSRQGQSPAFAEAAIHTGRLLAIRGIRLVYGGGSVGLMGILADACLEAGGHVTGVITRHLMDREVGHSGCTELILVDTMLERKTRMAELSDAFLSLPGGIGTLDELFEMLTWSQLHLHRKPNALLNVEGYYDPLLAFLRESVHGRGFADQAHVDALLVGDELESLVEALLPDPA
ncbi:MAG: TIGR00730 family Rossman fold protein [Verrucomicrobiales bacterium]|nr:TIGR00730 family Rossman fold protein [Verrucomicrobiales bacterium]